MSEFASLPEPGAAPAPGRPADGADQAPPSASEVAYMRRMLARMAVMEAAGQVTPTMRQFQAEYRSRLGLLQTDAEAPLDADPISLETSGLFRASPAETEAAAVSEETAAAEAAPARPKLPHGKRLDWPKVAQMIALGLSPDEIAEQLGCPRERIWRNFHRSRKFRGQIERERRQLLQQAAWRLTGMAERIANGMISGVERRDVRLLIRLADRLRLETAGFDRNVVASER